MHSTASHRIAKFDNNNEIYKIKSVFLWMDHSFLLVTCVCIIKFTLWMFSNLIFAKIFITIIKQGNKYIHWIWHNLPCNLFSRGHSPKYTPTLKHANQIWQLKDFKPHRVFDGVCSSTPVFKIIVFDDLTLLYCLFWKCHAWMLRIILHQRIKWSFCIAYL